MRKIEVEVEMRKIKIEGKNIENSMGNGKRNETKKCL